MKTIELTTSQRKIVTDELANVCCDGELFDKEIYITDELVVTATGRLEVDGYVEDDYYNGTGAFIETSRSAWVELKAYEDGNECTVDALTEQEAERALYEA